MAALAGWRAAAPVGGFWTPGTASSLQNLPLSCLCLKENTLTTIYKYWCFSYISYLSEKNEKETVVMLTGCGSAAPEMHQMWVSSCVQTQYTEAVVHIKAHSDSIVTGSVKQFCLFVSNFKSSGTKALNYSRGSMNSSAIKQTVKQLGC